MGAKRAISFGEHVSDHGVYSGKPGSYIGAVSRGCNPRRVDLIPNARAINGMRTVVLDAELR